MLPPVFLIAWYKIVMYTMQYPTCRSYFLGLYTRLKAREKQYQILSSKRCMLFFHRSWSFGILLWEIETGGNLKRFSLSVTIVCIYQIWIVSFTTSDFTGYRCKTDARYLEGKLMGYGNFKSDITGYRE